MAATRKNKSKVVQGRQAERRLRSMLGLGSWRAGLALALTVPLALPGYAAQPAAPSDSAGTAPPGLAAPAAKKPARPARRAQRAPRKPPVPLEDNGIAPIQGGASIPNTAHEPDAPSPSAAGVPPNPYASVRLKGLVLNLPSPANTIDLELGGFRRKLADEYGIGYFGYSLDTFYDNLLNHAQSLNRAQTYIGQRPTYLSQNQLFLIFDLGRHGIPDGQIVVSGSEAATTWNPAGPNAIILGSSWYYQTLFDKQLEFKIGILAENAEFVGTYVGGSLNGGIFGPNASVLGENGFSTNAYTTPSVNLTGHITANIYDKAGFSRASNPDGSVVEHNYNPTALNKFTTPNSGPLFIDELGYIRPAATSVPQTWVRGGAFYDKSRFNEIDHPGRRSSNQYGLYLLGDRQLVQTSRKPGEAYRGLYAGFSAEYAPPNYSNFSQYYEARLYALGIIPSRPFDQATVVFTDNVFSDTTVRSLRSRGLLVHSDSMALTTSYSAQVIHGLYGNLGLTYVNNPSPIIYSSNTGSALDLIVGTSIFF